MKNIMNINDTNTSNFPHIQSLLVATIIVAAFLGPISLMAAKMAGY